MLERLTNSLNWIQQHLGLTALMLFASIVVFVVSLWAVRYFLIHIPPDYFARSHSPLQRWKDSHPALRWTLLIAKNLLGAVLIAAGVVMIFTPGQGVLCLLLGISLVDIPGKRAFERRIIQRPSVLHLVNSLRARAKRPPLVFDGADRAAEDGQ